MFSFKGKKALYKADTLVDCIDYFETLFFGDYINREYVNTANLYVDISTELIPTTELYGTTYL